MVWPKWFLYSVCIIIWGTTWYAITFQLGVVPVELSIAYRFALASVISFFIAHHRNGLKKYSLDEHLLMFLQGSFMYGAGYIMVYLAGDKLASGINSVLFSTIVFANLLVASIHFKRPVTNNLWFGAFTTLSGISIFFLPELYNFSMSREIMIGIGQILLAVVFTAIGNLFAEKVHEREIPVIENNSYAMLYGAVFAFIVSMLMGHKLTFDFSKAYIISLLYLSIFGSVVTLTAYLVLLRQLGSEKIAFPLISIPIVSLIVSQIFESYRFSVTSLIGVTIIITGNYMALKKNKIKN